MYIIPEKIHLFNVYHEGYKLIGISDEITLPDFEAITDSMAGPGMLGEMESVAMGQFASIEMEIPFRQMYSDMFLFIDQTTALDLTLRGSIQVMDSDTTGLDFVPMRIVTRGRCKGITGGKAKQGTGTASSIKLEVYYILIEINGVTELELDKLNFVYKVHGKDLLEKVSKMC